MDATKNKNTPLSNLQEEDEFLLHYFNSLPPLKTKERVEATQMLNSLGMDYSHFASPDAPIHEDSIVLMRNKTLSTSKPTHKEALTDSAHACHYSLEPSSQHTKIELPEAMHDNPCSSEQCPLISAEEANWALELLGMQVPNGTNIQEVGQVEANIEGAYCEYNNLSSITQSVNLLPQSTTNSNYKMQNVEHVASSSKHEIDYNPSEPIAETDINQIWNNLANPIAKGIDEVARISRSIMNSSPSHQPEMTSLQRNNSFYTSNISSCTTISDKMIAIIEKPPLPRKNTNYSSGRKPESPSCTSSLHLSARQEHHLLPVPTPMERHLEPSENDDFTKSSVHIPCEDLCWSTLDLMSRVKFNDLTNKLLDQNMKRTVKVQNTGSVGLVSSASEHEMKEESADFFQNIPKRKRKVKRSNLTGEGGACRSCKCKKSRCLKNYCECFAAGVYCTGPCSCQDCSNKGDNEHTVLQARRNNDSKVVTSSNSSPQFGEDPNIILASKLQKRACNCNKSGCQRKYCACFKDGVGCSPSCKCQGCKNIHGRKDSTTETKSELEETKALQISRTLPPSPYSLMGKPPHISCSELLGRKNDEPVESNTNPECENDVESSPTRSGGMNSIRMRTILLQ
ncbi:protein tesmin/TSO1 CXC [Trifolium repens]|nr:protein tesmin/TSO1 CXC [Trifolium repens]